MNTNRIRVWIFGALISLLATAGGWGGMAPEDAAKQLVSVIEEPIDRPLLPPGTLTLGARFSEDLTDGFIDVLIPLWAPGDNLLFVDPRFQFNDEGQDQVSLGVGWRHLFPEQEIIVGANAYYDHLNSRRGFDYHQAGFGAELLSRWFDARFNYYLPENDRNVFSSHRDVDITDYGAPWADEFSILQELDYESRLMIRREAALEGFYAEAGFLTPWLDRWVELRWFGGYYHYDNRVGRDIDGWKARVEARVLPAVVLDLEYYEDDELMGGHWTGGVRVSVPFEIGNIFRGRNPFEGIGEAFRPRQREFRERMTEMVVRSARIRTSEDEDYVEDRGARREYTKTKTVANSVVFVDNASVPGGDGSFEDPVDAIQDAVDVASARFGNRGIVLVRGGGASYAEEVDITANSVALYGGACPFPVFGGESFQFGPAAVVEGGFWAQDVGSFTLNGFTINGGYIAAGAAVRASNVGNTVVECNTILTAADAIAGVRISADNGGDHFARVAKNVIITEGAGAYGAAFENTVVSGMGSMAAISSQNTIITSGDGADGNLFANTFVSSTGSVSATSVDNTIITSGDAATGIQFANAFVSSVVRVNDEANGNTVITSGGGATGIQFANAFVSSVVRVSDEANGNTVITSGDDATGIQFANSLVSSVVRVSDGANGNTVITSGDGATGIEVANAFVSSTGSLDVASSGNTVITSGDGATGIDFANSFVSSVVRVSDEVNGNTIITSGDGATGIDFANSFSSSVGQMSGEANGNTIITSGDGATGIRFANAFGSSTGSLNFASSGNTIITSGDGAYGIQVANAFGSSTGSLNFASSGNTITTTGDGATGIQFANAFSSSIIDSMRFTSGGNAITTTGDGAYGIQFVNSVAGSTIDSMVLKSSDNDITTTGDGATGIQFANTFASSVIESMALTSGGNDITTTGNGAAGIQFVSTINGSIIDSMALTSGGNDIITTGDGASGIQSVSTINGSIIDSMALTSGDNDITTFGAFAMGNVFNNTITGSIVESMSLTSGGNDITTSGAFALGNVFNNDMTGSIITLIERSRHNTINTSGATAYGNVFQNTGAGSIVSGTAALNGNTIATSGAGADGIRAEDGGFVTFTGTENNAVSASGGGGALRVNWVTGLEIGSILVNGATVVAPTDLP